MKVLIFISSLCLVNISYADHHEGPKGECFQQVKELCKDKKGPEKWTCMKESKSKLSAECQQKMADHTGACKADRDKFCSDIKPGDGRMIECMKKNEANLSPACKMKMAHKAKRHANKKGAGDDTTAE